MAACTSPGTLELVGIIKKRRYPYLYLVGRKTTDRSQASLT